MAGTLKLLGGRGWSAISQLPSVLQCNTSNFNNFICRPRTSLVRASPIKKSSSIQYRQLNPHRTDSSKLLQPAIKQFELLNGFPKKFFFRRKDQDPEKKRRVPKLILIQNPFTWLMIKIDFSVLRNVWDPAFEEKQFKFGTKQVS